MCFPPSFLQSSWIRVNTCLSVTLGVFANVSLANHVSQGWFWQYLLTGFKNAYVLVCFMSLSQSVQDWMLYKENRFIWLMILMAMKSSNTPAKSQCGGAASARGRGVRVSGNRRDTQKLRLICNHLFLRALIQAHSIHLLEALFQCPHDLATSHEVPPLKNLPPLNTSTWEPNFQHADHWGQIICKSQDSLCLHTWVLGNSWWLQPHGTHPFPELPGNDRAPPGTAVRPWPHRTFFLRKTNTF